MQAILSGLVPDSEHIMFEWLTNPSKTFAETMEIAFAIGLAITTLMVVIGLIGEYSHDERWKRHLKVFEMLVLLGVAGEMVMESGAFWYSLRLTSIEESAIASAQQKANEAAAQAANLGVSQQNLRDFVANEEHQNETAMKELKRTTDQLEKARHDALSAADASQKVLVSINAELKSEKDVRQKFAKMVEPRDITAIQQENIISDLKQFNGQKFTLTTFWDLKEPLAFTNKLYAVLCASGWKYDDSGQKSFLLGGISGIQVFVYPKASKKTQDAANSLVATLKALGLEVVQRVPTGSPDEELRINIGTKN
jgi:hypothetical protein